MAGRIRSIKPELLDDDRTASLPDRAWRVFVSALLLADDHGNFRGHAAFVRGQLFWARSDISEEMVEQDLALLEDIGLIARYEVRGQRYAAVVGWAKHQKIDRPSKPRVPGPASPDAWQLARQSVYFVQQGDGGPIKIGRAAHVERRLSQLKAASGHPLHLLGQSPTLVESDVHAQFTHLRMAGEWFRPEDDLLAFVAAHRVRPIDEQPPPLFATGSRAPSRDPREYTREGTAGDRIASIPLAKPPAREHPRETLASTLATDLRSPISDLRSPTPEPEETGVRIIREHPTPSRTGKLALGVVRDQRDYWVVSYEAAVAAVTGAQWDFPRKALEGLVTVVEKRCSGSDRGDIDGWIRTQVTAFVTSVVRSGVSPGLWNHYGPDGLQRWFNAGCKVEPPGLRRVGDGMSEAEQAIEDRKRRQTRGSG